MSDATHNAAGTVPKAYELADAIQDLEKNTCIKECCDYCQDRHSRVLNFVRVLAAAAPSVADPLAEVRREVEALQPPYQQLERCNAWRAGRDAALAAVLAVLDGSGRA